MTAQATHTRSARATAARRAAMGDLLAASAALQEDSSFSPDNRFVAGHLLEQAERWCEAANVYREASTACGACGARASIADRAAIAAAACGSVPSGPGLETRLSRQQVIVWRRPGPTARSTRRDALEEASRVATLAAVAYGLQRWKIPKTRHLELQGRFRSRAAAMVRDASVTDMQAIEGIAQVRAVLRVDVPQILTELRDLGGAGQQELPRVLVLGLETYIDKGGQSRTISTPVIGSLVEKKLRTVGYEVVAGEQATRLMRDGQALLDPKNDNDPAARRLAESYRAEIILKLMSTVRYAGANHFNSGEYQSDMTLASRAVDAATGRLIDTQSHRARGPPTCFSEPLLYDCAARFAAPQLVESIVQGIPQPAATTTFRVTLDGATGYAKQARPFIRLVSALAMTQAVRQISYASGRLELEVKVGARVPASTLVDQILAAAARSDSAALRTLDLRTTRGRELGFILIP